MRGCRNPRHRLPGPGAGGGSSRPLVVWLHGDAWIGGDKSGVADSLKLIAAHGYVAAGVNYALAPDAQYQASVRQTGDALR